MTTPKEVLCKQTRLKTEFLQAMQVAAQTRWTCSEAILRQYHAFEAWQAADPEGVEQFCQEWRLGWVARRASYHRRTKLVSAVAKCREIFDQLQMEFNYAEGDRLSLGDYVDAAGEDLDMAIVSLENWDATEPETLRKLAWQIGLGLTLHKSHLGPVGVELEWLTAGGQS